MGETKNKERRVLRAQEAEAEEEDGAEAEEREGEYGACDAAAARWWISEEVQSRVLVEIANARSGTTLRSASDGKRRENQIRNMAEVAGERDMRSRGGDIDALGGCG